MKLLIPLIFLILFNGCQNIRKPTDAHNYDASIVIGRIDSIYSNILAEQRKIWVYVPDSKNYSNKCQQDLKYPVLFILDGDYFFHSATGVVKQLGSTNGNTICPEMIIVGIPNTDRMRDFTPTHVAEVFGDSTQAINSGGSSSFYKFLEKELIPYIEKKYSATSYRTIIGHSLSGLSVITALVNHNKLFSNYVAIDPPIWWDNDTITKMLESTLTKKSFEKKSLFVGVANPLITGQDLNDVLNDTTGNAWYTHHLIDFIKSTEKTRSDLNFDWKYYKNDDHMSVPLIAIYDALRFLFPSYNQKNLEREIYTEKYFNTESQVGKNEIINIINEHYNKISNQFGYSVNPPKQFIETLGYNFLDYNMPDKAFALFEMNINNYPDCPDVFEAMGDYYEYVNDTNKATEYYSRASGIKN